MPGGEGGKVATRIEAGDEDVRQIEKLGQARDRIVAELRKAIIGMDGVIDEVMIAVFSRGHALLEGVPGLAKTLLVSSLARCLSLRFRRIQFTPDLMPSDIIGTDVLQDDPETGRRRFMFARGPIFANIILADEINRTPPKTQAALLEAMQEKMVSAGGEDFHLDLPFFVLATQNPLEQEGTYPLPEAQRDRFMFKILVDYPSESQEIEIMESVTGSLEPDLKATLEGGEMLALQDLVRRMPVARHISRYVARLVRSTRPHEAYAPAFVKEWVSWGAGPRACLFLITGGKARAALRGRFTVAMEDVQALALPVMRHRMGLNFAAQSEGVDTDEVVRRLLATVPADERLYDDAGAAEVRAG
jgi:MoxR-like ATPase